MSHTKPGPLDTPARPQRYSTKPVWVDAIQLDRTNGEDVAKWCGGRYRSESKPGDPTDVAEWVDIPTLGDAKTASIGDYVVQGARGGFYACKAATFENMYQRVTR